MPDGGLLLPKNQKIMATIENEVVRFVAKIDLDPEDEAAFRQGLKDSEAECANLRDTIASTAEKMSQLRARGEESSEEFKALESNLKDAKSELKAMTKQSEKYSSALGINQMSMKQLSIHAKQLRSALYSMSKEANHKLWEKYNKELIKTEERMKDVSFGVKGIKEPMLSIKNILGKMKTAPGMLAVAAGAFKAVQKTIETFAAQTQIWGDKWAHFTAGMNAAWSQFVVNISTGSDTVKGSIRDAFEAAKEASELMDELFERNNSLSIAEISSQTEINKQREIMNDSSKSAAERLAALQKIEEIENNLKKTRQDIANQELEATQKILMQRMGLNEEELKGVIDNYEANRTNIQAAQEYNQALKDREESEKALANMAQYGVQNEDETKKYHKIMAIINGADENIKKLASNLRQYDLGNDQMVEAYVNARKKYLQADQDYTANMAAYARKRGTLINTIESENAAAEKKIYDDAIADVETLYNQMNLKLKQQLINGKITEEQYAVQSEMLQIQLMQSKVEVMKKYGKDTVTLESQIADKLIAVQNRIDEALKKSGESWTEYIKKLTTEQDAAIQKMLDDMEKEMNDSIGNDSDSHLTDIAVLFENARKNATSRQAKIDKSNSEYKTELEELNQQHDLLLISEEEFLARKKELHKKHTSEILGIQAAGVEEGLTTAQTLLNSLSGALDSIRSAELETLEAQMQAELSAAGNNADERTRIEEEYEAKKLDTQKKYADADMAISIAKAIAGGALAAIQCFSQLGPIAGAVAAALVAVTTGAEIASIVAQRNAIKNTTATSSASSGTTLVRKVNGYSEGGYTGAGGRLEVAGVVHRGEYVVPQPEMSDPSVASMVAAIESRRRRRTSSNALPGYAEGGYAGVPGQSSNTDRILSNILAAVVRKQEQPAKAYVVLSELQAQQDLMDDLLRESSLRH